MIGPFIDRRWGLEPVSLPHPAMAEAVADTYGVILYQEQVLRIAQSVAGFDLADADSLRRAMTRDRSREEMAKIGETFISRAIARGVPPDAAREVFRQLEGFAAYGFNKSHSVCFAVISYATAWLKAHYPAEFLCSVLNNYPMGFYTPRVVLNDARRFGLAVRPLDVNLSGRGFTVEDAAPPGAGRRPGRGARPRRGAGRGPYDPFAQAWTADHAWGLTDADLAELAAEHGGGASTRGRRLPVQMCMLRKTMTAAFRVQNLVQNLRTENAPSPTERFENHIDTSLGPAPRRDSRSARRCRPARRHCPAWRLAACAPATCCCPARRGPAAASSPAPASPPAAASRRTPGGRCAWASATSSR